MLKIYGHPQTSAGRVYWLLEELGLEYETQPFEFKNGDNKKPEFLELNPNGKVPVIIDDGFVLWDSSAICKYLAEKHNPALMGEGIEQRALVDQWSFWAVADFQPPVITAFIQSVFVPEGKRNQSIIDSNLEKAAKYVEILESKLQKDSFIATPSYDVADISVCFVLNVLKALNFDFSGTPKVGEWLEKTLKRPSILKVTEKV